MVDKKKKKDESYPYVHPKVKEIGGGAIQLAKDLGGFAKQETEAMLGLPQRAMNAYGGRVKKAVKKYDADPTSASDAAPLANVPAAAELAYKAIPGTMLVDAAVDKAKDVLRPAAETVTGAVETAKDALPGPQAGAEVPVEAVPDTAGTAQAAEDQETTGESLTGETSQSHTTGPFHDPNRPGKTLSYADGKYTTSENKRPDLVASIGTKNEPGSGSIKVHGGRKIRLGGGGGDQARLGALDDNRITSIRDRKSGIRFQGTGADAKKFFAPVSRPATPQQRGVARYAEPGLGVKQAPQQAMQAPDIDKAMNDPMRYLGNNYRRYGATRKERDANMRRDLYKKFKAETAAYEEASRARERLDDTAIAQERLGLDQSEALADNLQAGADAQKAALETASTAEELKNTKALNSLREQLSTATDDAQRKKIVQQINALTGETPKRYTIDVPFSTTDEYGDTITKMRKVLVDSEGRMVNPSSMLSGEQMDSVKELISKGIPREEAIQQIMGQ